MQAGAHSFFYYVSLIAQKASWALARVEPRYGSFTQNAVLRIVRDAASAVAAPGDRIERQHSRSLVSLHFWTQKPTTAAGSD
jgi:hypothetical protein